MGSQFGYAHAAQGRRHLGIRFLMRLLAGTDLFIDVGARDGVCSLLAARRNPRLKIVAIERAAASCEMLRRNVERAGLGNIEVRQGVVSADEDAKDSAAGPTSLKVARAGVAALPISELLRDRDVLRVVVRINAGELRPALSEIGELLRGGVDLRLLVQAGGMGKFQEKLLVELHGLGLALVAIDDTRGRFYRVHPDSDPSAKIDAWQCGNLYCVAKEHALSVVLFAHSTGANGAERSLMALVDQLVADHGTVCTVVSPGPAGPLVDSVIDSGASVVVAELPGWASSPREQVRTVIRSDLARGMRYICRSVLPVLEKIDPHVIFTQTMVVPWGAFAAEVLEKPHAWSICEFGELDHGLLFSEPFAVTLGAIVSGSSFIFTNSDAIRTKLFPGFDYDRIRTIYRHIAIPENVVPADDLYRRPGAVRLGLFGTLHEGKGQHDAVQAVAELVQRGRNVELLLAGATSDDEYHARIERLIDDHAVGDRVRIVGFLEDPYPAIAATDICLVCSRNEAFGRVAVEAMLLGRPVVYARSGGVAEYMEEGVTGFGYASGSIDALVERIEALIDDDAGAAAMGAAGKRYARQKFTRDAYGGEVFRVLCGLRGSSGQVATPRRLVKTMVEVISAEENSRSRRLTAELRLFLAAHPRLRWIIRGAVKLAWWTVTLQLPRQLRSRWGKAIEPMQPRRGIPNLSNSLAVARLRYIQSVHERREFRNPDTLVKHFFPVRERLRCRLRDERRMHLQNPFYYYLVARTRHYDEVFLKAIAGGARRIINVGSGTDTRAYRFAQVLNRNGVRVIELDQPEAIRAKQRWAEGLGRFDHVEYRPLDLNRDGCREFVRILAEPRAKSLVLMEGVSPYIVDSTFSRLLRLLGNDLPSGSRIAYDFKLSGVDDDFARVGAARTFRLPEARDQVAAFHAKHGCRLEHMELSAQLSTRLVPDVTGLGATLFTQDGLVQVVTGA